MLRPRLIPVLLLQNSGLVKSVKFKSHRYLGDPINAVKIFNGLLADELVFLDIDASRQKRSISIDFVKKVGEEANMPFAVGGGIQTMEQIKNIIQAGAEKVIIGNYAYQNPEFIRSASDTFGSSCVAVCLDVKSGFFGKEQTWVLNGKKPTGKSPLESARIMAELGAGEIIIQSIERDGMMKGYDLELLRKISAEVPIPVIALGGAGNIEDMLILHKETNISGLGAGSMFVFQGSRKGILINYPSKNEYREKFFK